MDEYAADTYGERFAASYDEIFADFTPRPAQIELLRRLAGPHTAVELGVGTGRVAIPLARSGVPVVGVDTSAAMLDQLARKAAGLPVQPVLGDATAPELAPELKAGVAYTVFNTFFMLPGRAAQATCLKNVRALLQPGGAFVVEVFVPRPELIAPVRIKSFTATEVVLQVSQHVAEEQRMDSQDVVLRHGAPVRLMPTQVHYLTPHQLDLLAEESGLALESRHADWDGAEFTPDSAKHVSVYRRLP
ncbi:class I SAM-dependent methyltransferase [Streptomyces sp. SID10815]|uniref:class I SAM-dependent methyltransferase n=1 Tax=Streptomyces sp. SID10815 TaxID=2706027 RepID=UPI0013CC8EB5|nr:class I SAM-dependent methyltransferase [Streptomyces sp. SID10815]NEA52138.1 class I SAM-dependent methyltransferase [Streptomyces sp. SID10815]